jgi:iron complex transport system ATP-binding protein
VDLHLERGEFAALLGPNGAGKTTLLLALAGVLPAREGSALLDGRDIARMSARERARRLALVPQGAAPPPGFTVRELVAMGRYAHSGGLARLFGGEGLEDAAACEAALTEADCLELAGRRADGLSGGEYQRVLLARALCQGGEALLLDEAVSAMDLARRVAAFDLLARRNAAGTTVLAASHDLNLAALYCPRLIFLNNGRVALDGPTREVFTETNLKDIYETDIRVASHPVTGAPQAHLVPGAGPAPLLR